MPCVNMLKWQRMGEVADGGVMVDVASLLLPEVSISSHKKTNKERKKTYHRPKQHVVMHYLGHGFPGKWRWRMVVGVGVIMGCVVTCEGGGLLFTSAIRMVEVKYKVWGNILVNKKTKK